MANEASERLARQTVPKLGTQLGTKVRALRRREHLSQVQLAERLGISASYLNLIEHDRRPLPAALLIKLAQLFQIDFQSLAGDDERQMAADVMEAFGDDLFEGHELTGADVREFVSTSPPVARAVLTLYQAYQNARQSADGLAAQLDAGSERGGIEGSRLPSEEVSDFIQRQMNYFPELEEAADRVWREARLELDDLYAGMVRFLGRYGIEIRVERVGAMRGAMRRYDVDRKLLTLSEALPRGSRNFQLAHQVGLLVHSETLNRLAKDHQLTTDDSRALARVALANYFGAAVTMPYQPFFEAARAERYDVELLGHRFGASFEQICHRMTTLRRPGSEGIPFHLVRVDIAGNISKRFSGSGIRFARFSAACPRWNVHTAFLTPGMIRVQLSQMPDGVTYFCIARTLRRDRRFHAPHAVQAIGMGCEVSYARQMVYADGIDLDNLDAAVPVGITCRLCERMDCQQRAFPAIQHRLQVDENVRGLSFYAPVGRK